ncbi:hypothetical protein TEA_022417 [Camellia sinensis var. sinensis]|uniref:Uncharacterized protein n=1 Tax=Camellia sinensis var. sinensis TaxID=542762 RepID=A0A4V6RY78_CAMSN|nr:hypothetical protein TEA_022417 [Camellia sinensis var. sinensis]
MPAPRTAAAASEDSPSSVPVDPSTPVFSHTDVEAISPFLAHAQSYSFQKVSGFFCQPGDCTPTFITLDQHAYGIPSTSLEFLPEPTVIRSSCNGLLLCQGHDGENVYYICNPVNKEWRCRALACVNDDVVMILVGMVVYSYHLREQKVEVISRRQDFGGRYLPYVNSLVLLAPEY